MNWSGYLKWWSCTALLVCVMFTQVYGLKPKTEENCEVCVKFVTKFMAGLPDDEKYNQEKIEKRLIETCKTKKGKDERFCYTIGAAETSATRMLNELTRPASLGMPAGKICAKINDKMDSVCDLKYEKQIDLASVNFRKLKVKDLKRILSDWDESCKGCTEKTDYINRIKELMPKHDPEAAEKLRQREEL
ncbi:mesencephalic astrocyte-derived neurotrophic factor homolog [Lineus longissimus]|uniref:mesencephalic astrocyte-derived neurotrophic factor homolog n=1 Tax=Lineus longissimus TaxID=88925 RepID=UPI002B4F6946